MRIAIGLIVLLIGARANWQIGLLASLGLLPVAGAGPVVGAGTTFLYAGLGALAGGLLGVVVCLLILGLVSRMVRLR
jgi:hypothetical protein